MLLDTRRRAACLAVCVALSGCEGDIGDGKEPDGEKLPDGTPVTSLLPTDVRRLTKNEYSASVIALTGTSQDPREGFPPDARQQGYTVNEGQIVETLLVKHLAASAKKIAADMKPGVDQIAPCADPAGGGRACAQTFITSFGAAAYRRPLDQPEIDGLLAVYDVGAIDGYPDGIELVIRALLQSAGMLYLTQLGEGDMDGAAPLSAYELASAIAYLTTGGPPDATLMEAAARAELDTPEGREAHVRRLLETPAGRQRVVALVEEWLEIDRLADTAKDSTVYPAFADAKPSMQAETTAFVTEVLASNGGVQELLGAPWSVVDASLAGVYGASGEGRVDLPDRRGLLNRGAFLAVHAHATETAPVLRGVSVLRRVACFNVPSPTTLNINVVPPVPDPTQTTRERYSVHAADPACRGCHQSIDPIGFSFEAFDGMGARRPNGLDNGKPVDTSAVIETALGFEGSYADSNALAEALAASEQTRECFARQLFRGLSGYGTDASAPAEDAFLERWSAVPEAAQGQIAASIVAFARSSVFSHRRIEQ
jgi:hypothetical protein